MQTAFEPIRPNGQNRAPPTRNSNAGLAQAYTLRDLAAKHACALDIEQCPLEDGETKSQRASSIATLIRAWDVAIDRVRALRGKPSPGTQSAAERARTRDARVKHGRPARPAPRPSASLPKESLLPAGTVAAGDGAGGASDADERVEGPTPLPKPDEPKPSA